jgi:hypothetical protein
MTQTEITAQEYERAEANYLAALRLHDASTDLVRLAESVASAADSWQRAAYEEFFGVRDSLGSSDEGVSQIEIEAEIAEALFGLWTDIAAAHRDV